MKFDLKKSLEILQKTPTTIKNLIGDLSEDWIINNEGGESWSPYDIIGHLIHGEKTDWIPRLKIMLSDSESKEFPVFDRFAQFENSKGKSLDELLEEFNNLRIINLTELQSMLTDEGLFDNIGYHPEFGEVNVRQLLSTWVVHDLNHLAQISRVMAFQYRSEVGPWFEYLGILKSK